MNLNTHIAFALAVGLVLFHNDLSLAVLVGIGAALPDLTESTFLLEERYLQGISCTELYSTTCFSLRPLHFSILTSV
jgi:hypothetical protein